MHLYKLKPDKSYMIIVYYLSVTSPFDKHCETNFFHFSIDYYSLKSGSRPSSPGPSPTPSVAGSVTSTSSSARQRRPLISPARLNISGQKLRLFSSPLEPLSLASPPPFLSEQSHVLNRGFFPDVPHFHSQNHGIGHFWMYF